jgi:hypothetical protein
LPSNPTSPHWYTPAHLARLISAYLNHDAVHGRTRTVRELVSEFRGLSGTGKQKTILEATGLLRAPLTSLVRGEDLDARKVTTLGPASVPEILANEVNDPGQTRLFPAVT